MRYELDTMDLYSLAVNKTVMENASFFSFHMDENIDRERLEYAVRTAFKYHPLFECKLIRDKEYYLETNTGKLPIFHIREEDRPKEFGKNTDDFLFQFTYFDNVLTFEWCHIVSDGKGALEFVSTVLNAYFGLTLPEVPTEFPMDCIYKKFYKKDAKPYGYREAKHGFYASDFPLVKRGYRCLTHRVTVCASDIIRLSKKADGSPAALLVPLFSRAIRKNLPKNAKNTDVTCGIVIDVRKALKTPTMHNAVINKVVTYDDRMNRFELDKTCTLYRSILDLACTEENIAYRIKKDSDDIKLLLQLRKIGLHKLFAKVMKNSMNNIAFTYIGKLNFAPEVISHIENMDFRSWPDIGCCVMAAVGIGDKIIINITENYKNDNVVPEFVCICKKLNIDTQYDKPFIFEQANARF